MPESTSAPAPVSHGYEPWLERQRRELADAIESAEPEESPFAGASPEVRDRVRESVEALGGELGSLAQALYDDPETAFQEHRSVRLLHALLASKGIEAEVGAYGLPTALHARLGSADGPQIAVLAEYDALPGIGHACGHNLIAAIGTGAFLALASVIDRLGGGVHLIGTPAEEGGAGKQLIIDAGGFEGIDAALMVHPGNANRAFGRGAGLRHVDVTYRGRAAHAAAAPFLGANALDGVVAGYLAIAMLRQHILQTDRIHGVIVEGGGAPNVVPNRTTARYYVRSADVDTLDVLVDRVVAALEGAAVSTGTEADIILDAEPPYLPMQPNLALSQRFVQNLAGRRVFPPRSTARIGSASTDMGNVSRVVPSIHPNLAVSPPEVSTHTAQFAPWTVTDRGTAAIADGALGVALTVADLLADAELRREVAREFERARNGG